MCNYSVFTGDLNSNSKTREVGGDNSLLSLNCYVSSIFVLPTFNVFKVVHHEYHFEFSSTVCQSYR